MKPLILALLLAPTLALAQTAPNPAPMPTLSPQATTEELAKLHSQVTKLQDQLSQSTDDVQSLQQQLDEAQAREQAFQAQVDELKNRGTTNEDERVARIHALDGVADDSVSTDYLMTLGSDDLDSYLTQLQSNLEALQQSTGVTGGRLEYEADSNALAAIQAARQALEDGDYFTARGYLSETLSYAQAAQAAAGANPMRAWTGK